MTDEMPKQPTTVQLPAADPVQVMLRQMEAAITASMQAGFRETNANIDLVSGDLRTVKEDVRGLQRWKAEVEQQPPITSERAKAIVQEHTSQVDLTRAAADAVIIVENNERDRRIKETHALASQAATKEDVQKFLADASEQQTAAILERFDAVVKNPIVSKILYLLGGAVLAYLASKGIVIK